MAFPNEFVYGYHGCSRDVAEMLLSGKDVSLNSSENDYDWLGSGIYFWEEAPSKALRKLRHPSRMRVLREYFVRCA